MSGKLSEHSEEKLIYSRIHLEYPENFISYNQINYFQL